MHGSLSSVRKLYKWDDTSLFIKMVTPLACDEYECKTFQQPIYFPFPHAHYL